VTSVEQFHINHLVTATGALIYLITLTFDLLTLKLVRIIAILVFMGLFVLYLWANRPTAVTRTT